MDTHSGIAANLRFQNRRKSPALVSRSELPPASSFWSPLSDSRSQRYALPAAMRAGKRCGRVRPRKATLIWFNSVGPTAKPPTVKTAKIALITRIGCDPVGPAAKPSAFKTDKITLITWIRCDPVNAQRESDSWMIAERSLHGSRSLKRTAKPSAVKTDEITLITLIGFDPVGSTWIRTPNCLTAHIEHLRVFVPLCETFPVSIRLTPSHRTRTLRPFSR